MTTTPTPLKVARLHLIDWITSVALPWGALTLSWAINLVVFSAITAPKGGGDSGGLATIYAFILVLGITSAGRFLPFGITLGLSRRTYYRGIITLAAVIAAPYAAVLTILNLVEGATSGWGVQLHFFRIPWLLDGPWYRTFLTEFVLMLTVFLLGTLLALGYLKVGLTGVAAFLGIVSVGLMLVALLITWGNGWHGIGNHLEALTALGLTGWLALVAAAFGASGYATIRRLSV
jgi:hypothetical protein